MKRYAHLSREANARKRTATRRYIPRRRGSFFFSDIAIRAVKAASDFQQAMLLTVASAGHATEAVQEVESGLLALAEMYEALA